MCWFHAEFVGRDKILESMEKPSSLVLSPTQIGKVVSFARKYYERIGSLVTHKITKKRIGCSTLVST